MGQIAFAISGTPGAAAFPAQCAVWALSQVKFQRAVNPADTLVVPGKALDVAQIIPAQTKAPVPLVMRQPDQPVGNLGVLIRQLRLVTVTGLADRKGRAGQTDTYDPAGSRLMRLILPTNSGHVVKRLVVPQTLPG